MRNSYRVLWTGVAKRDLREIVEFIACDSPDNAMKILHHIRKKSEELGCCPERGRIVPELLDQGINFYRELLIQHSRLLYRISEDRVFILSIIDSRRNVEDILLHRFLGL
jgi:toxin ParE1/3/4